MEENLSVANIILIVAASITCTLCFLVIITTICFKLMRKKFFMHVIMMISLSDFLGNLATFFPLHNGECTLHGMWYFCFFGASYIWTILLSYLLYGLATQGKVVLTIRTMHIIVWPLATIRGILPYSSVAYTSENNYCSINIKPGYGEAWSIFWNIIVFPVWIGVTFTIIIYFRYRIHVGIARKEIHMSPTVKIAIDAMELYPFALVVCWTPRYVMDITNIAGVYVIQNQVISVTFILTLNTLHGSLIAIIFFWKSTEARRSWMLLYKQFINHLSYVKTRTIKLIFRRQSRNSHIHGISLHSTKQLNEVNNHMKPSLGPYPSKDLVFTESILNINEYYHEDNTTVASNPIIGMLASPSPSPQTSSITQSDEVTAVIVGLTQEEMKSIRESKLPGIAPSDEDFY